MEQMGVAACFSEKNVLSELEKERHEKSRFSSI